jgi:uncharacterized damage-inducible protein DinB
MTPDSSTVTSTERSDFHEALTHHRDLLLRTVRGLSDAQARLTPTASQLCLAGIVKHVSLMEEGWVRFIEHGRAYDGPPDEATYASHAAGFTLADGETLAAVVDRYRAVARATDALVDDLPSLDVAHPLPEAPWFEPGAQWSARRVLVHIVAETAQHAGHADIIRETIDGAKSMG